MAKIKAVSVTTTSNGSLYVVSDDGRLFLKAVANGAWSEVELPEESEPNGGLGYLPPPER